MDLKSHTHYLRNEKCLYEDPYKTLDRSADPQVYHLRSDLSGWL